MRYWGDPQDGILNMLMLNPSTADEKVNDPTVQLCEEHARAWGYAGLLVTNIFAWRSTDPKALYKLGDPIGVPENDAAVLMCARGARLVVCAWGQHGKLHGRGEAVRMMLTDAGVKLHYLRMSEKTGQPWHPLYLGYDVKPIEWKCG
jgi:hypothetical protein